MTSNAGSNLNTNSIGFGSNAIGNKNKILDALKQTFRPEFLNRVDEIVVFEPLNKTQLLEIVDLMVKDTKDALAEKNISLELDKNAKEMLLEKGTDLKYGARPLRRAITRFLEDELSERILKQELKNGQKVLVSRDNNNLTFEIQD